MFQELCLMLIKKVEVPPKWVSWWPQREWEEDTGELWSCFWFYSVISGDLGEGRHQHGKKKPVTNEVPQALEISWSRYLILFSEKPFNFLLLKRSNLLFVAKLPKLIGWFISPLFISFELHTEVLSNATCCLRRSGSTEAGLSAAYVS